MKIQIMRVRGDIMVTALDLQNASKGEVAHAIAELERIKLKLISKWSRMP